MNHEPKTPEIEVQGHPVPDKGRNRSYLPPSSSLLLSLAVLGVLIFASGFVQKREYIPPPTNLQQEFPRTIGEYRSEEDAAVDPQILDELELTDYLNRSYVSPQGHSVHVYVGYVKSQSEMPLIHTPVGCLPGGGNAILSHEIVPWWQFGDRQAPRSVNLIHLGKGQGKQLVVYWYQERGRIIHNDWLERFYLFRDAVLQGRTDGALVRFITPVGQTETMDQAQARIRTFVQQSIPALQAQLPGSTDEERMLP